MSKSDFLSFISSPYLLGDPHVQTQHLLGGVRFERKVGKDEVVGYWQIRAAHQRYLGERKDGGVECVGHGHGMVELTYRKEGAAWKIAGVKPYVRFAEGEFEKIFRGPGS